MSGRHTVCAATFISTPASSDTDSVGAAGASPRHGVPPCTTFTLLMKKKVIVRGSQRNGSEETSKILLLHVEEARNPSKLKQRVRMAMSAPLQHSSLQAIHRAKPEHRAFSPP